MLPVNQFILSGSDPLFNSGNLNEQIQYLEEQKRIIDARQKQIQQVVNGQQILPTQQQPQVSVWAMLNITTTVSYSRSGSVKETLTI